jgi:hypothetical protein
MKLPTTPFYLSHEAIGTKGHLTTREIERIWGETLFFLVSFELIELSIILSSMKRRSSVLSEVDLKLVDRHYRAVDHENSRRENSKASPYRA